MTVALLDETSSFQDAMAIIADMDFDDDEQEDFSPHLDSVLQDPFDVPAAPTTYLDLFENTKTPDVELFAAQPGTGVENKVAQSVTHTTRKSGISRRQELEDLRDEVCTMQRKLSELRTRVKHPALTRTTSSINMGGDPPLWKGVAARQKIQREQAEARNIKLRSKLNTQIRMAKSLIRTLQSREAGLAQLVLSGSRPKVQLHVQRVDDDGFAALLGSMDNLFVGTDNSVRATPVACLGTPHVRDAQIKRILTGEYLEFQDSRFLPFTIDIVNQAMWRFLREAGISSNHYNHDHQEKQDDTILRTYGIEIEKNNGVPNLQGKQSMRRYFRGTSVVIVRKSVILPAGANGVEFVEKGWIVLSPAPGQAATVIQEFSTISPRGHHMKCGLITDGMIATREEMVDKAFPILENILFEEAGKTLPSYSE